MAKDRYYKEFSLDELEKGLNFMKGEFIKLDVGYDLNSLFNKVWKNFKNNKFSYDGATFVKERSKNTIFEVASFIHDYRNSQGYVGKRIDNEFLDIMITLNYPRKMIIQRWLLLRCFTWLNVLRHRFILKDFKKGLPNNYYKIEEL